MKKVINLSDYREQPNPAPVVQQPKKNKRRRHPPWRVILMLMVLVAGVYGFMRSPLFAIDINKTEVSGNRLVSWLKIVELADIPADANLFAFNLRDCAERLSQYPYIASAQISCHLPDTLQITVQERQPVGFIVTTAGYIQVSSDGRVLAVLSSMGNYNLPVITGIDLSEIPMPGEVLDNAQFGQALTIISSCDPQLLSDVAELNVGKSDYVLAYTYQGIEIRVGNVDYIQERMASLKDILQEVSAKKIAESNIQYIDIRYRGAPVIKMKDKS